MVKGADTGLRTKTISADRKFVASPMEDGLRIAGNVEFAGLQASANMRRARPMFRKLEVGEVTRWMGHRPGAVTGKIVSQLAAGLPPTIDLTPFRADRF